MAADPFLCAANGLGVGGWFRGTEHDRFRVSEKPGFVLALCEDDLDPFVRSGIPSARQEFGPTLSRTIPVSIEKNEDSCIRSTVADGEVHITLQFCLLDKPVTANANRSSNG